MVKVELSEEELNSIISLIEGSSVPIGNAEKAIALFNKLKNLKVK